MELLTSMVEFYGMACLVLFVIILPLYLSKVTSDTRRTPKVCVHREPLSHAERLTVQPAQSKSKVGSVNPVQAATCLQTKRDIHEAVSSVPTVESDSNVTVDSDPDIAVKDEIVEPDEKNMESAAADDDDDWEGIEKSEVEKEFMAATEFVSGEGNRLESVGSNVQMELYGLHKVAIEGPCCEPPPMPLKLSARAKWNAWQKLGNMSPEVAMEQYISLLSDKFPGWMKDPSAGMSEHEPTRPEVSDSAASDISTTLSHQQMIITERELEQVSDFKDHNPLTESDLENNVNK
ncbi:acyl-CoA-binding domain-containing protein 3 isoform X2 [Cajanus cajan]|uniref:acyl-CoA-binding domain-containing protein 3 isoform X2 n=1 Tax=Cajanus cajan TaxID=3821 RepID=UPI00098D84FB|nr:acyl-CoA-binding domain-containing protein 3 isoform X2 [Cajanus cajan]